MTAHCKGINGKKSKLLIVELECLKGHYLALGFSLSM